MKFFFGKVFNGALVIPLFLIDLVRFGIALFVSVGFVLFVIALMGSVFASLAH
jgi:hypothetical protein